jgi:GT2 family glycosyltransferase
MASEPILSVIVATFNARDTVRHCLRSLAAQTARPSMEVIVVDSSSDGTAGIVAQEFPWAQRIVFAHRQYCGDARNAGLVRARGRVIAFFDADCTAKSDWATRVLRTHERHPDLAIGGAIANGNPQSLVGWGAYFCEFSDWMPGSPAGPRADIAGASMSYKKEAFERYGDFIGGTYCSDTEFHWRLARAGLRPRFEPDFEVFHRNISSFARFASHEFEHGRSFARVRVRAQGLKPWRRGAYALLFIFVAAKIFCQIAERNIKNPVYFKKFCFSLPLVLGGVIAWSLGEAFGYVRSCR